MEVISATGKKLNYEIVPGDNRESMKSMPEKSVHCVVTSPPYYGLRNYFLPTSKWEAIEYAPVPGAPKCISIPEMDCCLGLETSPEAFIGHLLLVFRDVWRVMRDDGTAWLNLGDSFAGSNKGVMADGSIVGGKKQKTNAGTMLGSIPKGKVDNLKGKDLMMIPHRVALALQADGWYVRQDIVWAKGVSGNTREGNVMPESVTDRCVKSHEYLFLLSKKAQYYFDNEAIKEKAKDWGTRDRSGFRNGTTDPMLKHHGLEKCDHEMGNRRSVWRINPTPYKGAHFATFPPELIKPCILAGTSEYGVCSECGAQWERIVEKEPDNTGYTNGTGGKKARDPCGNGASDRSTLATVARYKSTTLGFNPTCTCDADVIPATVLDPYSGSGTTVATALSLGRSGYGLELNHEYIELSHERIAKALHPSPNHRQRRSTPKKPSQSLTDLPLFSQSTN